MSGVFLFPAPEMTEADAVISLCAIHEDKFAYSLMNGEVGVYRGSERFWRVKVGREGGTFWFCVHVLS